MAKVTIIVPVYNVEKYIEKCLKSLIQQTYQDFLVYVVNDGSPFNEQAIINRYAEIDNRIIPIIKENGGYGSVLEYAIERIESEYFLVCDPDDWLEDNALENLVELADKNKTDITFGARKIVITNKSDHIYDKMFNSAFVSIKPNVVYKKGEERFNDLFLCEPAPHCKLYRTKVAKNIKFPYRVSSTDNVLFYLSLLNSKSVIYTDVAYAYYLIDRDGNTMTDVNPKVIDQLLTVFQSILEQSKSIKDVPDIFYFVIYEAIKYIFHRSDTINTDDETLRTKLLETNKLLKNLLKYRRKIFKQYSKLYCTNKTVCLKNFLLLNPFTSNYLFTKWVNKKVHSRAFNQVQTDVIENTLIINKTENVIKEHSYKVSAIVPVYNVEKYLRKCLDSLVNQTLEDIEIIVVNDESPDNSQAIIDEYVALYPNKVKSLIKPNGGLSDARNYALPYVKGEYIVFIDSDDYVDLDMFKEMYEQGLKTNADIVVCDMEYVYDNGKTVYATGGDFSTLNVLECPKAIAINNSACNKLFKPFLFMNVRFPKGKWYEDIGTIPKVITLANIITKVNKPFYKYFQRTGSIVHTASPKIFDIYDCLDDVRKFINENIPNKNLANRFLNELDYMYLLDGAHLTTIRIKEYDENRVEFLYKQVKRLEQSLPNWYSNHHMKRFSFKQRIVFTLLKLRMIHLLLFLLNRKGV